jgi:iron complex outermembrane receptor protein
VVTAQKRASSLQTTSLAMTALSGDTLKDKAVVNLEGLTTASPSFSFANQGPTAAVNIRGIGLGVSSPNVAPGVPIYRDGLLAPTLLTNEPFLDVGSVEVLRGPQGTLVGANSTGGAVFINTVNPKIGAYEGYAEVEAGSYHKLHASGALNIPVSDTFALRAAGSFEHRDSYWTNLQPNLTAVAPGAVRQYALRLSALYQPNEHFSALLKVNYQKDNNGGWAHTPYPGTPAAVGYPTQPYVLSYGDQTTISNDDQIRAGLELKYVFDGGITLKSITGTFQTHQYYDDNQYTYTSATTALPNHFTNHIHDQVYTQEFNLVSPATRRFHWVIGNFNLIQRAHISIHPNTFAVLVDEYAQIRHCSLWGGRLQPPARAGSPCRAARNLQPHHRDRRGLSGDRHFTAAADLQQSSFQ